MNINFETIAAHTLRQWRIQNSSFVGVNGHVHLVQNWNKCSVATFDMFGLLTYHVFMSILLSCLFSLSRPHHSPLTSPAAATENVRTYRTRMTSAALLHPLTIYVFCWGNGRENILIEWIWDVRRISQVSIAYNLFHPRLANLNWSVWSTRRILSPILPPVSGCMFFSRARWIRIWPDRVGRQCSKKSYQTNQWE